MDLLVSLRCSVASTHQIDLEAAIVRNLKNVRLPCLYGRQFVPIIIFGLNLTGQCLKIGTSDYENCHFSVSRGHQRTVARVPGPAAGPDSDFGGVVDLGAVLLRNSGANGLGGGN